MTVDDMRELFGDGFDDYQAEAEQKWGETAQWEESQRRTKSYGKDEWVQIKAEGEAESSGHRRSLISILKALLANSQLFFSHDQRQLDLQGGAVSDWARDG